MRSLNKDIDSVFVIDLWCFGEYFFLWVLLILISVVLIVLNVLVFKESSDYCLLEREYIMRLRIVLFEIL